MKIKEINIEGFRGINRPLSIKFDNKLTVISGENGAGKTSIFQAIEWCLFGVLDLSGVEFQREDAIVNDFHPNAQARVELTLNDGSKIVRTRKKKSKTGFGKRDSDLTLICADERFTGDQAQQRVDEILCLTAEELGVVVHLRQETIRDFIQGEPAERSATVDKMIGLFELRELISGLDLAGVDKEIAGLEKEWLFIDQNMVKATLIARDMLSQKEKQIISDGITRESLSLASAIRVFEEIGSLLRSLAKKTGRSDSIASPASIEACQSSLIQSKRITGELQEARIYRNAQIMADIQKIQTLQTNFQNASKDLEALSEVDPKKLAEQRTTAVKERSAAQGKLSMKNPVLASLRRLRGAISDAEASINSTKVRLEELGAVESAEKEIVALSERLAAVEAAIKTATSLSQLLPIAADYLQKAQPSRCPVCQREFDEFSKTLNTLQQQVKDDPAAKQVEALRQEYQSLNGQKQSVEQRIREIGEMNARLQRHSNEFDNASQELVILLGETPIGSLLDLIDRRTLETQKETMELENQISECSVTATTIDGQLRSLRAKQEALEQAREEIIRELKLPAESQNFCMSAQERIDQLNRDLSELQALGPQFSELNALISCAQSLVSFLQDRETLLKLEKDYPTAVKQKESLERAIAEMRNLKLALQDIYQAAVERQRSLVEGSLEKLLPEINQRFFKILGHPVYTELQIIPEEEKKGVYRYWIGARDPEGMHSTYVATRFSTAQRNAAALAIFLAMAKLLPHNLDVLMIDEPTQSMDPKRQKAIAEFLANESQNSQVIIATEIPEFAETLRLQTEEVVIYNLQPWNAEGTATFK